MKFIHERVLDSCTVSRFFRIPPKISSPTSASSSGSMQIVDLDRLPDPVPLPAAPPSVVPRSARRDQVFYSILVDRFANGDITNDNSPSARRIAVLEASSCAESELGLQIEDQTGSVWMLFEGFDESIGLFFRK